MSLWYQAPIIHYLARCLNETLRDAEITECFTTSKDDWFLLTTKGNIHVTWFQQDPYIFFPDRNQIPLKNRQKFHSELGGKILQVTSPPTDRRLDIITGSGTLVLAFYGRNSRIYWLENEKIIRTFRGQSEKAELTLPQKTELDKVLKGQNEKEFLKSCPFFPDALTGLAREHQFYEGYSIQSVWEKVIELYRGNWFIGEDGDFKLAEFPNSLCFPEKCEAIAYMNRQLLRRNRKIEKEGQKQALWLANKTRLENQKKALLKKIHMLQSRVPYKTQADLILTYAFQISKGMNEVSLSDASGTHVVIRLKPELNAVENAERYYRKSKGEYKELEIEQQKLKQIEEKLANLTPDSAEAKHPAISTPREMTPVGYFTCEIEGFEVWVGKHAKGNIEILRKAAKTDIWMHARDEKGAHLIIRCAHKKPENYILEKAASLAAWNSKGKGNSLVRVVWAYRKHVRQIPGIALGTVAVQLENTILAAPLTLDQLSN